MGTIGDGIIRVDLATGAQLRFQRELPDSNILALFVDRQQTIWIGTRDGLVRLIESPHRPDVGDALRRENIGSICEDLSGTLWTRTIAGAIFRTSGGVTKPYHIPGASPDFRALSFFADRNHYLWIGSAHGGIARIKGTSAQFFSVNDGMRNDVVQHFYEDSQGMLWLSTMSGLVRWDGSKFHNYYLGDGLAYGNVRVTAELKAGPHKGDLLVGTEGGLNRIHELKIVQDDTLSPVSGERIWAIQEDQRGGVWIGTRGRGLVRWKDGVFRWLTTREGLLSNSIFQILQDGKGRFWFNSPSGVFSIDEESLKKAADSPGAHVIALPFDSGDGPRSRQMNGGRQSAGVRSSSGELLFPSVKGLVRIDPEQPRKTNAPVLIESIRADDTELDVSRAVTVPAGTARLVIRYTVCNLLAPERVSFHYLLEGMGHDWAVDSAERVAHYTGLRPGHYRFRVVATDASSPERPTEAVMDVDWKPRFHEEWWFLPACAVALLSALAAGVWFYANQTKRYYALMLGERTRLAREMHDTVIQGCVGVSTLLDAAGMTQSSQSAEREKLFADARAELRNTIDEAREAVGDLRNAGKQHGLPALLSEFASRVNGQDGLLVETHIQGTAVPLENAIQRNLLLVAREAIRNAIAHGTVHRLEVRVCFSDANVRLEVADDGTGFDAAAAPRPERTHYGLVGMRERVESLNGVFNIKTSPGRGTTVIASIPLDSNVNQYDSK